MNRALLIRTAVVGLLLALPSLAVAGSWGKLVSEDGKQTFNLDKASVVVGTHKRSGVVLQHPTVASRHLKITHKAGIVTVSDLGSRTGTLVAGTELKKGQSMQLYQRTLLSLGAYNLYFEWGNRGKLIKPLRKAKTAPKAKVAPAAGAKTAKPAKAPAKNKKKKSNSK